MRASSASGSDTFVSISSGTCGNKSDVAAPDVGSARNAGGGGVTRRRVVGRLQASAMHSISRSNSMGQEATGTKVRDGGLVGKNPAYTALIAL